MDTLQEQRKHTKKMVGEPRIRTRAFRSDASRIEAAVRKNSFLDTMPTPPEHMNFALRQHQPANQRLEPKRFRITHNLQIERVLDEINKQGTRYFKKSDLEGHRQKEVSKAIKQYAKTGKVDFNPGVKEDDYDSETEFLEAYQRDTTLHATDFVVEPRSVIP
jgi:hypothetical protein